MAVIITKFDAKTAEKAALSYVSILNSVNKARTELRELERSLQEKGMELSSLGVPEQFLVDDFGVGYVFTMDTEEGGVHSILQVDPLSSFV